MAKYKAFISYSHADEKWARWLHRSLEKYRIPKLVVEANSLADNRFSPIFRDREDLATAGDLSTEIRSALAESENLIVICSKPAAESRWVSQEITEFKKLGKQARIFCLLVDDPAVSIPSAILRGQDGCEESGKEPLAADARHQFDGRRAALLKLLAGMLGIGLDDLRQREQQRRYRRMSAFAASSVVLLMIMTTLTTFIFMARNETERQRQLADEEAATAEATIGFLVGLFEINDPFSRGNIDASDDSARGLFERGATRIDLDLESQPQVQARLRHVFGEVYHGLGLYNEAEAMLEASVQGLEELYGPNDPRLARVLEELARVNNTKGNLESAESQLWRALSIWQLNTEQPGIDEAMVLNRLSPTVAKRGRAQEGVDLQRRSVAIIEAQPDAPLEYLALCYHTLGWVLHEADELHEAVAAFSRALDMLAELDTPGQEIQTRASLGSSLMRLGDLEAALAIHAESLVLKEKWFGARHPELAYSHNDMAWVTHEMGDYETAIQHYELAIELFLEHFDPEHANIAVVRGNMAEALGQVGRLYDAKQASEAAVVGLEKSLGEESLYLMSALIGYGRVCNMNADTGCALQKFSRAFAIGQSLAPEGRSTALAQAELAALPNAPMSVELKDAAFVQAHTLISENRGANHPDRAEVLINFARHLNSSARAEEGVEQFRVALEILKERFGEQSPRYTDRLGEFSAMFGDGR